MEEPILEAVIRLEKRFIVRARGPVTHDFCGLCKVANKKAGQPIDHWFDCPIYIVAHIEDTDGSNI